jgi:leucyl aminopeptidase
MSNGPARKEQVDRKIQASGDLIGDMFEVSTIRREDFKAHKGKSDYEDLMQAYSKPSAVSARGHQGPAAFLIMSSGLDKHGGDSDQPLAYSHVDIAGSCGKFPGTPSAVPLPSFVVEYVLPKL